MLSVFFAKKFPGFGINTPDYNRGVGLGGLAERRVEGLEDTGD